MCASTQNRTCLPLIWHQYTGIARHFNVVSFPYVSCRLTQNEDLCICLCSLLLAIFLFFYNYFSFPLTSCINIVAHHSSPSWWITSNTFSWLWPWLSESPQVLSRLIFPISEVQRSSFVFFVRGHILHKRGLYETFYDTLALSWNAVALHDANSSVLKKYLFKLSDDYKVNAEYVDPFHFMFSSVSSHILNFNLQWKPRCFLACLIDQVWDKIMLNAGVFVWEFFNIKADQIVCWFILSQLSAYNLVSVLN